MIAPNDAASDGKKKPARRDSMSYDMSEDEIEFARAISAHKVRTGQQFLPWSEVLRIVRGLGYRKAGRHIDQEVDDGD